MREELRERGIPVFNSMIRRTAGFAKAALAGLAIRDIKDSRTRFAWSDYQMLGEEIKSLLKIKEKK
jgi:chromosome partitioning protein